MKKGLVVLTFFFIALAQTSNAGSVNKTYKGLMNRKLYFSAVPYIKELIRKSSKLSKQEEKALEKQILKVGSQIFLSLKLETLKKHDTPVVKFLLGMKLFKMKRYKNAYQVLKEIPNNYRFSPESRMIEGSALAQIRSNKMPIKSYRQCVKLSSSFEKKVKNKKVKRYYNYLKESCILHIARTQYAHKEYKESLASYNLIEKTSYKWPQILIEKAWAHYYLNDYNRSLGLLVTYKSPLLSSYFYPEGEVLSALSYHKLCLWDDSLLKVEEYYKIYKKRSEHLKGILNKHKASNTYFIKLVMSSLKRNEKVNPFIRNMTTGIKKQVKFSVELYNMKRAKHELKRLRSFPKTRFNKQLISNVKFIVNSKVRSINHYVKSHMYTFINDIHKFSYEMFNVKLEVLSKKRQLAYSNLKQVKEKRARGSYRNIASKSTIQNWDFKGAFWADELGEYSFGLASSCKTKKNRKDQGV